MTSSTTATSDQALDAPDPSDTDSFVSLSRSLREDLWRQEGPIMVSNLDEERTVSEFRKESDVMLAYNMTTFASGRGGDAGEHLWEGSVPGRVDGILKAKRDAGEPVRILNVGPGRTYAWGMYMAQTYPFAEVIILEKFLDTSDPDVPANLTIEIGTFKTGELSYPDEFFTLVYSSLNLNRIDNPTRFIEESARVLQPGGVFSLCEWDSKFYAARRDDERLMLAVDRDAAYDAALTRKYPEQAATFQMRNLQASSLGQSVRASECFVQAEENCDSLDYTAVKGHPVHLATGKRFLLLAWMHSRDALGLTDEQKEMMKAVDERVVELCPPGVLSDYHSVIAFKA